MYGEKRTLLFSVIILIISFVLIYFVYFNQTTGKKALEGLGGGFSSGENYSNISDYTGDSNVNILNEDLPLDSKDEFLIDGLSIYDGNLDILDALLLVSDRIYDYSGNYIALITGDVKQLSNTVNKIGGNTVEITNKKIILDNQLVGDRLIFINIPEYKNQKVILLIEFKKDNNIWFLSFDVKDYYRSKTFLKKFFESYDE